MKLSYKAPELHGPLKLSYKAPWLLGLLGCQVLCEPSYTTLLNLSYKAPELHGPSSSSRGEGARGFNADLTENRNRLRGSPGI